MIVVASTKEELNQFSSKVNKARYGLLELFSHYKDGYKVTTYHSNDEYINVSGYPGRILRDGQEVDPDQWAVTIDADIATYLGLSDLGTPKLVATNNEQQKLVITIPNKNCLKAQEILYKNTHRNDIFAEEKDINNYKYCE